MGCRNVAVRAQPDEAKGDDTNLMHQTVLSGILRARQPRLGRGQRTPEPSPGHGPDGRSPAAMKSASPFSRPCQRGELRLVGGHLTADIRFDLARTVVLDQPLPSWRGSRLTLRLGKGW